MCALAIEITHKIDVRKFRFFIIHTDQNPINRARNSILITNKKTNFKTNPMNTKAFAVAAVFGASAALAYECPDLGVFPDNYNDLNWKDLAVKKFDYMDNCPKDGIVSYRELVRYSGEVPKGLN